MDYSTYMQIRGYCYQDLCDYLELPDYVATRDMVVKLNGQIGLVQQEYQLGLSLFQCLDLSPRERAAAHLLAVISNHFAIAWQRAPEPPNGNEPAPPLKKSEADALNAQTREAIEDYVCFLPESERAPLLRAYKTDPASDADTDTPAAGKVEAVKGITKGQVTAAFQGSHFDADQWGKALGKNIPDWLKPCRAMPGRQGYNKSSATWNPVLIAAALYDKGITIQKLDAVFVGLKDWADEWRETSDCMR